MSEDKVWIPELGDVTEEELLEYLAKQRDFTLEQLQNMTKEDYWKYFLHGNHINKTALLKAIYLAASKIDWGSSKMRGVREFWYNPVKPIIYRAFGNASIAGYVETLSAFVKKGNLTYKDLGIIDYRTQRKLYEQMDKARVWNNVILFVEKDSAYVHLRPIKELLNISIVSGAGWSKTACTENIIDILKELDPKKSYILFTVTDYDPFGFSIGEEFMDKAKLMGLNITKYHRLGILLEYIDSALIEVQKYPVKRNLKSAEEWCKEYGIEGPKGKVYGLEIEAVSGQEGGHDKLRQIVLTELLKFLDENDLLDEIREVLWDEAPIKAIDKIISSDWNIPEDGLPKEFLTQKKYKQKIAENEKQKDEATEEVRDEIERLKEELEKQLEELEAPFNEEEEKLDYELSKSKSFIRTTLEKYYESIKDDQWSKEKWDMNLPAGVLMEVMKEGGDIHSLIKRASDDSLVNDIYDTLKKELEKGTLNQTLCELVTVMKEGGS